MYTAPSTERLQSIIATTTNQIINAEAFCRISTQFYKQHPDEYLIMPTTTNKSKDEIVKFWKQLAKHQHKYPDCLENLHFFQLGNHHHLFNSCNIQKCYLCLDNSSNETINHLLEKCAIPNQVWNVM
ncbi:unnamed protein product [Ambrosiozyma monospora]|uniref:Unnamed protein product n=1 Tax=Ambrosiozyma monospora TaxID=43982 RepID=A0A9W6SUN3_AMBMO|nr:unnamed protein product [Ambrosiozyma monospora]